MGDSSNVVAIRSNFTSITDKVAHYCKVVTAVEETIKIQGGLDELFDEVEKKVLNVRKT